MNHVVIAAKSLRVPIPAASELSYELYNQLMRKCTRIASGKLRTLRNPQIEFEFFLTVRPQSYPRDTDRACILERCLARSIPDEGQRSMIKDQHPQNTEDIMTDEDERAIKQCRDQRSSSQNRQMRRAGG